MAALIQLGKHYYPVCFTHYEYVKQYKDQILVWFKKKQYQDGKTYMQGYKNKVKYKML
jgi:hypothetical protein